ncbi:Chitin synthase 3, partial [Fusarium oxysporum f. sp. cubense race 1]
GHSAESQVHVPIPSDLADAAGLNLDSTTEENVYEMAHLTYPQEFYEFEFTSHLATHLDCEDYLDGNGNSYKPESRSMKFPVQLMLLMKTSNCGKLNSYRWLYNGFARVLDPNMTVNLDVGTKLGKQELFKLLKEFDLEPMLAAACGEISCSLGGSWLNLLNPSVTAQNFEYKVGFQLDRTFESATRFLSLLPATCSAYRYVGSSGKPLEDMLLGDPTWIQGHNRDRPALSPVNLNRHLPDDRVICFRTISKPNTQWLLKYVPVTATTVIPMTTTDFINQRRRWLNGAFFSTIYVLKRCGHLWRSDHTIKRKVAFFIPLLHSVLALVLAWFSLAVFLLSTFTINRILGDPYA